MQRTLNVILIDEAPSGQGLTDISTLRVQHCWRVWLRQADRRARRPDYDIIVVAVSSR
jgi:hypothetical protein